jgi:hypothetical protein
MLNLRLEPTGWLANAIGWFVTNTAINIACNLIWKLCCIILRIIE